jgi:ATP-binding protein involved in chromosome partitioning
LSEKLVNIEEMTPGDRERLTQDKIIEQKLSRIKRKILVMSGKGGVGKSTVAAYTALLLSRNGSRVGLLDVDLHGPTIPHLLDLRTGLEVNAEGSVKPCTVSENLQVVSLEMVLGDRDTAVIWRGPLKISAIKQFISDIEWGDLDYLIIDSPPGTGDEPLTVAQTIPDAEALIVTTPQEISLADVRKSINFCRQLKMKMIGVIENMSGFQCPHCGENIGLFGGGGATRMAEEMDVPILGEIPIDPVMVDLGDKGQLAILAGRTDLAINRAYHLILERIKRG